MKTIVLLLVQLAVLPVLAQTYSSVVSDTEVREFMNWVVKNKGKYGGESTIAKRKVVYRRMIRWDMENFEGDTSLPEALRGFMDSYLFGKKTDSIFTDPDEKFMFEQFKAIKDTVWRNEKFKWAQFAQKKRRKGHAFSLPLFSVDRRYVIISHGFYCPGFCSSGGDYIYRHIGNNKWRYVMTINSWVV